MDDAAGRDGSGGAPTRYLPAGRTDPAALAAELAQAARTPLLTALLQASGAAAVVLDGHRQIVAVNAAYLGLAGVERPEDVLGLRPGEALACAHADDGPDGCGTGRACASCGQAVALLIAGRAGRAEERTCHLARRWAGAEEHLELRARAAPLELEGARFTVVSLVDVTRASQRAQLERVFLHDLANLAIGLKSAGEVLRDPLDPGEAVEAADDVVVLSEHLVREVHLQRAMTRGEPGAYAASRRPVPVAAALDLVRRTVTGHPAHEGRRLALGAAPEGLAVVTDPAPLQHVLVNMVVNALEATPRGGTVRLVVDRLQDAVAFRVWNPGAIPAAVVPRIFQRHFTTKRGEGRGHGTYSMKLFGERLLGGRVRFTTSAADGTWFELLLEA
ncbi:sensor histidine kinase [Anaeromyxobacter diazotrophicus]|uniref:histidine kinase n=1 Tax=Anaeromyxobacter diazotrophicus TaxID=2590199 RepID=A0A7I9VMJ7_9BACT|nr:sensor histidine kinase [Anaeromyxobacter diazotrophicus]GEJ57360.1 sensor histidine kinase [Anaeromyxobacter diazotrophicus]